MEGEVRRVLRHQWLLLLAAAPHGHDRPAQRRVHREARRMDRRGGGGRGGGVGGREAPPAALLGWGQVGGRGGGGAVLRLLDDGVGDGEACGEKGGEGGVLGVYCSLVKAQPSLPSHHWSYEWTKTNTVSPPTLAYART